MENAWLDSLSEDWVSQPRSASPEQTLPSLSNSTSDASRARAASSRIPKYNPQKQSWAAGHDSANSPLSERSSNETNIPLSQRNLRRPSKLRELTHGTRGRGLSRTLSASSIQSVQYHTVQHKSHSLSPRKGKTETPEWKRRLIHGEVAYGEQRDLFSPAGLENIFRPPPTQSPSKLPLAHTEEQSLILPSSPPPYNRKVFPAREAQEDEDSQNCQQPRAMKYELADEVESDFSVNDLSRSSSFQPAKLKYQGENTGVMHSDNVSEGTTSVVRQEGLADGVGRTVSGQSDIRNEELSPIYVGRHNTVDGKIDYTALNLPPEELTRRLENIREESPLPSIENQEDVSEDLRADMTVETDDYAHNGRFINLRRGGRSQEGSFQKRMLSPSSLPAIDESAMLPEESVQASTPKQLPNIKKTRVFNEFHQPQSPAESPQVPDTPQSSPTKSTGKEKNISGSPLKLFGTHDTFTNQTLLRRLSQFESNNEDEESVELPSSTRHESTHPEMNEAFVGPSSPDKVSHHSKMHQRVSRKMSSFGRGDLDGFQFSEDMPYDSSRSNSQDEDKENMTLPLLNPDTQSIFIFQLDPSPALDDDLVMERRTRRSNTTTTTRQTINVRKTVRPATSCSDQTSDLPHSQRKEDLQTPRKRNGEAEGKRLPKSPLKDPTPKRRRTLHKSEIAYENGKEGFEDLDALAETHQQMQSVIGRKRKDARHENDQQAANPTVLAMRQIARPRTPTPSQRSSQQQTIAPLQEMDLTASERGRLLQDKKLAKIQAELDSTEPLKASPAFAISLQMQNDSRKGSVTTQDFLDEAKKIMAGIRGKVRPHSGLTSLEESETENDRNQSAQIGVEEAAVEDSYQESTQEPFSRPPSREGAPVARLPKMQENPALLHHLRKYQEMSDIDEVVAESMKSIAMAREVADSVKAIERITDETISKRSGRMLRANDGIESDPPNTRISENPDVRRKRKHSTSSLPVADDEHDQVEFPSHGSNASSGQSTSRSIPTGSSRGSDSRGVIAPHTVSRLIPEQVAGMVFDRERNKWVKRKTVSNEYAKKNCLPSDDTEDDPFGDIPDLSVDETQELQRIKAVAKKKKEEAARGTQEQDGHERRRTMNANQQQESALSKDKKYIANDELPSSEPSKLTRFASSGGTVPENNTRVTSWGEEPARMTNVASEATQNVQHRQRFTHTETRKEIAEDVEKEISILEDRVGSPSPQRRNVTIAFSSPIASVIQGTKYDDESSFDREADGASQSDNDADFGNGGLVITKEDTKNNASSRKNRSFYRSTSRQVSLGGHKFSLRPVSRIDEQDEDSIIKGGEDRNRRSISIVVSTPAPLRREASIALVTPRPTHEVGTLTLTPLSEFTMHHGDDESFGLDVSYVAQRQRYVLGTNASRTLSVSIKELVEKITEVEPYEPFWENLKKIVLKGKRLTNLHKLDEFCQQLEQLDVSRNKISQLDGVPKTVRHLRISHNCLTDLAAWGHLSNLQYIDVSNNVIESLSAFKYLVHLRGLRADNNQIKSLDGIVQHDGLLTLRMRGNLVETLDFTGTKLQSLTDLDLQGNKVTMLRNIEDLRSLEMLNLEENKLSQFSLSDPESVWSLKYLKLSGNNLECIDISRYPNLRLLYLDRNRLGLVTGLLKTKHLDSLSLREQQTGARLNMSFLSEAFEIRKLFLSGNLLSAFNPQIDFLNLQYLELANCGLRSLPPGLGQMITNTRVLNLNLNALRDISPLVGIIRLKKLLLAGNRLTRLRSTVSIMARFPHLTLVDLRANSLTLGFYPPVAEMRMILGDGSDDGLPPDTPDPFTQGSANRLMDDRYVERLDMDSKMLRRVYEILVLGACPRLRVLDGLTVDRSVVQLEDDVWEGLLASGVLARSNVEERRQEEKAPDPSAPESTDLGDGHREETPARLVADGDSVLGESQQEEEEQVPALDHDQQGEVLFESPASEEPVEDTRWPGEDSFE